MVTIDFIKAIKKSTDKFNNLVRAIQKRNQELNQVVNRSENITKMFTEHNSLKRKDKFSNFGLEYLKYFKQFEALPKHKEYPKLVESINFQLKQTGNATLFPNARLPFVGSHWYPHRFL